MKTHSTFQIIPVLTSFAMVDIGQAACRADTPEIGDIGPDGDYVCEALEQDFPSADIQLYDRKFLSTDHVIIAAKIDDKPYAIDYRLEHAAWIKFHGPCLAEL